MFDSIKKYCDHLITEFDKISQERKNTLEKISDYISKKLALTLPVNLIYICTHNSRRSHFGQIWAKVASDYFKIKSINTFSGGTEATASNANVVNALKNVGFNITIKNISNNPVYFVKFSDDEKAIECFSKEYNHSINPTKEFAAIMTCSDAEENCPFIPGVELRIGTSYNDPKAFDNMPLQDAKYNEGCRQIALETFYVFSQIK